MKLIQISLTIIIIINLIKLTQQYDDNGKFIHFDLNNHTVHVFSCSLNKDLMKILLTRSNQLNEIYLQHCNIPILYNAAFIKFSNLIILEISDSQLNEIEDFGLNGLQYIKYLNLARNNLTGLKSWSTMELTSLISLDMRRNQIHEINSKNFQRYPNLQKLNFAVNFITEITSETFRPLMNHLKYLNLGKNLLKRITIQTFHGLIKLSNLALHYNQIEHIDEMAFETNTHLKTLRLEGNRITTLNFMHILSLARLVHFNISHNNVESLEQFSFAKDFELRDLDISYNQITELNKKTLSGLHSLEMLNASHNQIGEINSKSFNELTSLTHLDFSANLLENLDETTFNYTIQLEYLNMSRNNFYEFNTTTFNNLKSLKILDLSLNDLYQDNFLVNMQSNLEYLDLNGNEYKSLNMSVLYNINYVNLESNPWNCEWLLKEYIRAPPTVHFGANYSIEGAGSLKLDMPGIECFNGKLWKSLIVVNKIKIIDNYVGSNNVPVQRTIVYKFRLDRFDQKSVIIWLILFVFIIFTAIRIMRKLLERSERKKAALKQEIMAKKNDYEELPQHPNPNSEQPIAKNQQSTRNGNVCQSEPCIPNCAYNAASKSKKQSED